jgi:protein-disulfide isomerase
MTFQGIVRPFLAAALIALGTPMAHAQDQDQDDDSGWQEAPGVSAIGKQDRLYGKPNARFSLIVWLDPECPYCKVMGRQPQQVVDASGGQVNLAVRLYPLPMHGPNALMASITALCVADQAGPAGYYRFLDSWMQRTASNGQGIGAGTGQGDPVAELAAGAGARNRDALAGCTTSDQANQRLAFDMQSGDVAGIEGTPAVAVRDNRFGRAIMISGAVSAADMRDAIKALGHDDDTEGKDDDGGPNRGGSVAGAPANATR